MANFTYDEWKARKEAAQSGSYNNTNRANVAYVSDYLKRDGDSIVVRFPYKSLSDIIITSTHNMLDLPKYKFGKRVRCEGKDCPICAQDVKVENRVFLKFLGYFEENNSIVTKNLVWDRPAVYADTDLKSMFEENEDEDFTQMLFKLKRTGTGKETRYILLPVKSSNVVFNNNTCPEDFTELNDIAPENILSWSYRRYDRELHPEEEESSETASTTSETVSNTVPSYPEEDEPEVKTPSAPTYQQSQQSSTSSTPSTTTRRTSYKF